MRCEDARLLLSGADEPEVEVLEALFAHVDACPDCARLDASQAAPFELAAMAPMGRAPAHAAGAVRARLDQCEAAWSALDASEEPAAAALEACFGHVDDCGPCRIELDEATPPLALQRLAAELQRAAAGVDWEAFGRALSERIGAAEEAAACLSAPVMTSAAAIEPGPAALASIWAAVDADPELAALEAEAPAELSAYRAALASSARFEGFAERVAERIAAERFAPAFETQTWARRSGAALAAAAALLLGLTLWQLDAGPSGPIAAPEGGSGRTVATPAGNAPSGGMRGFRLGQIEWVELSSETDRRTESFSNEATLPGEAVEYSLPAGRAQPRHSPEPTPPETRRRPAGPAALSF